MAAEKLWRFRIRVEGNGRFPIDMLRYDACYPSSEEDSHLMDQGWAAEKRQVTVLGYHSKHWTPNVARWKSFGWVVLGSDRLEYI